MLATVMQLLVRNSSQVLALNCPCYCLSLVTPPKLQVLVVGPRCQVS